MLAVNYIVQMYREYQKMNIANSPCNLTRVTAPILILYYILNEYFFHHVIQWSFGITCWEVFSAGKNPYPGVDLLTLVQVLENGRRLEKPLNTACSDTMYVDSVEISYPVTTCQMHIGMFVCLVKVSSPPLPQSPLKNTTTMHLF